MKTTLCALIIFICTLSACAANTNYRRSAVVPTPVGEPLAQPMKEEWQLSGSMSFTDVLTDPIGAEGDSALHAAEFMFHVMARRAISRYFNVGLEGLWSHRALSQISNVGTLPVEDDHLFGVGVNMAVQFPIEDTGWTLGTAFATSLVFSPWAVWQLQDEAVPAAYSMIDSGYTILPLYRFSLSANYDFSSEFAIHGGLSLQNSAKNIGFGDAPRDGSTLNVARHGVVPFVGAIYHFTPAFFARAQFYLPIGYNQFGGFYDSSFGGFALSLGAEL